MVAYGTFLVANTYTQAEANARYPLNTSAFFAGKNKIINGNCSIWQRGTSFSIGAFDPRYTTDRWYLFVGTGSNTVARESTTVPTGATYATKWTSGTAGATFGMYQIIESLNSQSLAGQTITISAQVTGTTGKNARVTVDYSTTVDAAAGASFTGIGGSSISSTVTSGTFSTVTFTGVVPANAKTVRMGIQSNDTFASSEFIIWGNAQLEAGSVATAFQTATGTIQGELAACQRYYWRQSFTGGYYAPLGVGSATSTTTAWIVVNNPVTMRIPPTSIDFSTLAVYDGVNVLSVSAITFNGVGNTAASLDCTVSGATQYRPYRLWINNNVAGYLGLSEEL